ncbi:MAG: 3-dehydroquinate synthase II [Thaumarchaeota archaeon]|nr:3-dehydroquinate synthase II [Nitrososphaerota archaeon]
MKEIWIVAEDVSRAPGVDRVVSRSRGTVEGKGESLKLVKWSSEPYEYADPGSAVLELEVRSSRDEENALKAVEKGFRKILVKTSDWKVIPWENLVAKLRGRAMIIAEASSVEEAKLALRALELGVDGVALNMPVRDASRAVEELKSIEAILSLREATVEKVSEAGVGLRACIDACDTMNPGEGMLIGAFSSILVLVEAEVAESGFTKPRPFRVNAGAVSQYVLSTKGLSPYISDLKSGDIVLAVSRTGEARPLTICRMKVERRPLRMIEVCLNGSTGKVFLQDAETIRVVAPEGSTSVRDLKPGDRILAYAQARVGRHFGTPVEGELMLEF